jgi:hypothetical protein
MNDQIKGSILAKTMSEVLLFLFTTFVSWHFFKWLAPLIWPGLPLQIKHIEYFEYASFIFWVKLIWYVVQPRETLF